MIYFVRHGLSESNTKRIFSGQRDDSPLTSRGREQAEATGNKIQSESINISRIVSSPSKRSIETAQIIAKKLGFNESNIIIDKRIVEYDMGMLTGTPWYNIPSEILTGAENAESPMAFHDRVLSCAKEYLLQPGNTLFVSHGGVGKMLEIIRQKKNPKLFYDMPIYPDSAVTQINWIG